MNAHSEVATQGDAHMCTLWRSLFVVTVLLITGVAWAQEPRSGGRGYVSPPFIAVSATFSTGIRLAMREVTGDIRGNSIIGASF
jgi:hypothetical protein